MPFPQTRLRRLRQTPVLRDLVRETRLDPGDFVMPLFVEAGLDGRTPIAAMPGVDRLSISAAVEEAGEVAGLGIPAVLLFGIPEHKDEEGTGAYDDEGIVQLAGRVSGITYSPRGDWLALGVGRAVWLVRPGYHAGLRGVHTLPARGRLQDWAP